MRPLVSILTEFDSQMLNNRLLPDLLKAVDQIVWVVWEPRELEEANHQVPDDYISYLFLYIHIFSYIFISFSY